jgi:hypothetical protein
MVVYGQGCHPQNIIWTEAKLRSIYYFVGDRPVHLLPKEIIRRRKWLTKEIIRRRRWLTKEIIRRRKWLTKEIIRSRRWLTKEINQKT